MQLQKTVHTNDLRPYFAQIFGKSGKLILNTKKEESDVTQVLTRAQEAQMMYGLGAEPALKAPDTKLVLITTKEEADAVFKEIHETKVVALDVETSGFDHRLDKVVSYQLSPRAGISYYFPFNHKGYDKNLDLDYCMARMGEILADPTILKVGHNLKFDYKWWLVRGYSVIENVHDTMIMANMLNESRPYGFSLKELVAHELKIKMIKFSELNIWEKQKKRKEGQLEDFSELSVIQAMPYACPDTDLCLRLQMLYAPQIEREEFRHLFKYVEMPLIFTIARMEMKGMKVNKKHFDDLSGPYTKEIEELTAELIEMAAEAGYENPADKKGNREPFNPASPTQVGKFTEMLGLTTGKYGKNGKMSVDKKGRAKLADKHPAFKIMDTLSKKSKLLGTYIDPLRSEHIHPITQRVHASFNQMGAGTGRLSSSDPNMQNIPKQGDGVVLRHGFVPEEGYRYIRADYSQIELKIVAHMSRCQGLIDAFNRGDDVHAAVAIKAFGLEEKYPGVTPATLKASKVPEIKVYRDRAKAVSFGILYGTTSWGLSKNLNCSAEAAQKLIDDFYAAFPELRVWIDKTIRFAQVKGYVETMLKRRRRFFRDEHGQYRNGMDRAAQNTPVQGTSADITKWAMVQVERALKPYDAHMVSQIHDEILVECREDQVDVVGPIMKAAMEDGLKFFGLPLLVAPTVEMDIQKAWGIDCSKCAVCSRWAADSKSSVCGDCADQK